MNRLFGFALVVVALAGCSDPARPHLETLVSEWGRVVGTQYPELANYDGDEREIRYLYANSATTYEMLNDYLSVDRPISAELKQFLVDWREVSKQSMELHKTMIDEGRFTYNESDKERAEALTKSEAAGGFELLGHLEGY